MKNIIKILIAVAVVTIGVIYIYLNRDKLSILKNIKLHDISLLIILYLFFLYATGYVFKILVGTMNIKLSFTETIGLSVLTNFANYLGPARPGAALKAVYLKKIKGFAYTHFTSVFIASAFIGIFIMGVSGFALLILMYRIRPPFFLFAICTILIIFSAAPFFCKAPPVKIKRQGRISNLFRSTIDGLEIIRSKKYELALICTIFIVQFFLSALMSLVLFNSMGIQITFLTALFIGVFNSIANLLTVTPSNIGVQETVTAYLLTMTGFDFTAGIIGASIGRIVSMIVIFSLAPIFSYYLLKNNQLSWQIVIQEEKKKF